MRTPQTFFELLDPRRQRRLRDVAGRRGTCKMPLARAPPTNPSIGQSFKALPDDRSDGSPQRNPAPLHNEVRGKGSQVRSPHHAPHSVEPDQAD
jgi:hypothetical protein